MKLFSKIAKRARRLVKRLRPKPRCSICGGTKFTRGPHRRLSATGKRPWCAQCRSLERHRAFRKILLRLDPAHFSSWNCLQFSRDPTASPDWFGKFEASIYGSSNSLDLQAIDRADRLYDVVICNHVLEHVPDYRAALKELARILNPRGFLLLSFPDPYLCAETVDWGYPKAEQSGHYRTFGRDIEAVIAGCFPGCHLIPVVERDDVTGVSDMAYVVTGDPQLRDRLKR